MVQQDAPIAFPFQPAPTLYHPAPVFGQLREEQPVTPVVLPDGGQAWLVTGHAEVRQVLIDPRFSRAAAAGGSAARGGLVELASQTILGMDPPEHTRLRRLVVRAFTARRVEQLRPRVAELVDQLLVAMRELPQPVDLVEHFALPLPVQVICELLGVPAEDRHTFHGWSDTLMGDLDRDPAQMRAALENLQGYFRKLIAQKREQPADDLMTALIAARDEQDKLSEFELEMLGLSLLIAGHETTANQINMFLLTLLHHRAEWDRLCAQPELIPQAVEELLRFVQLGDSAGGGMPRVTTEEVDLGPVRLPAGAVVLAASVAANRDPGLFDEPDRLALDRADVPHLTFGAGVHHCLGAPLARMELQEALRGLVRYLPGLRVAVPDEQLRFKAGMVVRSLEALPVTW